MILELISLAKTFLGFGDTIKSIAGEIARVQVAKREAETNERKLELDAELRALEARRDVLAAEAPGSRVNQLFRVALSIPALFFLFKVIIWDLCLGLGSTPNPSQNLWIYIHAVVGFYLLNRTVQVMKK